MGNNIGSNNEYLKSLQNSVMNDDWLKEVYGKSRAEQQNALKKVFTVVDDNDITASQKQHLMTTREKLQDKVEKLEAKMAVLEEEIAKNQEEIDRQAKEITNLICSAEDKSEEMEAYQKAWVKQCVNDVFSMYRRGQIGKDEIATEIAKRVSGSNVDSKKKSVERVLGNLNKKQAEVASLVNMTAKWLDQRKILEAQYGVTKSTYELIGRNLNQIGATEASYTNADTDVNIPVFSLEKTDIVSELFESTMTNVPATNSSKEEGATAPTVETVQTKFAEFLNVKATSGVDSASINNAAVVALGGALDKGLLNDLRSAGLGASEIGDFLIENFGATGIKKDDSGKLSVPFGHGSEAQKVYSGVTDFFKKYGDNFEGSLNTWSDAGNTVSSNKQMEALTNNYDAILTKLGTQEPKFTFKEAMYALFNPDTGLFKDCGITYDLSKQTGEPNYQIALAGDSETSQMYKGLADKIFEIWGVKANGGAGVMSYDDIISNDPSDNDPTENNPTENNPIITAPTTNTDDIRRTDPLAFRIDNTEYAFVIDRNKDNQFSGKEDFVGGMDDGQGNNTWLDDLKSLDTDGNNILEGDELKNLKLLKSDYTDNASTTQNADGFMRSETTEIGYGLTNAQSLGINSIDLNAIAQNGVGSSQDKFDINGSELFNDGFTLNVNGQDVDVKRKDDTDAFMNTVYSAAYGKNLQVGLNESEVQEVMDENYNEFDKFNSKYANVFDNVRILQNVGQAAQEAKQMYDDHVQRMEADTRFELKKAANKAAALTYGTDWESTMESKVRQLAAMQGVAVDMEQAKGMYIIDKSMSAQEIIDECIRLAKGSDVDVKTSSEIISDLKKPTDRENRVDLASELSIDEAREKEIYDAFNKVFNEAGLGDKVVDALALLCDKQQQFASYMINKSGKQLAENILKEFQK